MECIKPLINQLALRCPPRTIVLRITTHLLLLVNRRRRAIESRSAISRTRVVMESKMSSVPTCGTFRSLSGGYIAPVTQFTMFFTRPTIWRTIDSIVTQGNRLWYTSTRRTEQMRAPTIIFVFLDAMLQAITAPGTFAAAVA